ncbi:oxidoreductase CipA-like protein [Aspergillus nomiae NRRL 13137]|uniref:Oxidoreductase CipA-like protein n=1 Tax=Aspergillus nomiae NRRL (strain ATCC 15546 / NRRL 13137 / CBS 260.88 / M93) TaxID=1509407 RepID=A0A0L1IY45_ASPN3|nr:oxidoreductase CipA-like protein [Aspergillus nomiae NRRL 13137]KNG84345.1 oxidoreductase CipA-like protein [Aspergillus nomiae NRRL 13137]
MTTNYVKDQGPDFRNEIQRVAIIGAGGTVGKPIAQELLKTGKHTVTALTRVGGQNTLPEGIQTVLVDYHDETSLVNALKGQDAVVITLPVTAAPDTHSKIVQAAAKAGVKYVMPNVWGCDAANDSLVNSGLGWERVPRSFEEIEKTGVSSWMALICGFWYEHSVSLGPATFGFNFAEKKVVFFDDGKTPMNVSTTAQCGRAVAKLLSLKVLPEDENDQSVTLSRWLNKPVYISSFRVTQKEIFESWKRVTGEKHEDWTVVYESSRERYEQALERVRNGDHGAFVQAMYSRVLFPNGDADYESKHGLANEPLGVPQEDLDTQTRNAKAMVDQGYDYMTKRN